VEVYNRSKATYNEEYMAKYMMQEMPDMQQTGKRVTYPTFAEIRSVDFEQLVKQVHELSGFHEGVIEGVMIQMVREMANLMADGCSVKVNGLGTFTPTLTLRKGKEREGVEEDDTHRNAQSICVGGVNFKAEKTWVGRINRQCRLERSSKKAHRSSTKYTPQQRLERARTYLDEHPFLTVREYQRLTGLTQTPATNELRRWGSDPESGIDIEGYGAHRVYVRRKSL
jgi:predicted histone-like DNA-binding protein